jgi:hypothetical protein
VTKPYPKGKDIVVLTVNEDGEDAYLTADDGIALYTKGFIAEYGKAVLVDRNEDSYWSLVGAAQNTDDPCGVDFGRTNPI